VNCLLHLALNCDPSDLCLMSSYGVSQWLLAARVIFMSENSEKTLVVH
jgi:hypothetical protein